MKVYYLHGMGGSPADWRWVQEQLPGEALATPEAANPEACASALSESIPDAAVLCGYSMGGRLAILTAEKLHSEGRAPRALVLVSTGFGFSKAEERSERLAKDHEWAALAERDLPEFWRRWYQQELFAPFHSLPEEAKSAWLKSRALISPAQQFRQLSPACHEDLWPVLQRLSGKGLRVLFVVGELDKKYLALSRNVPGLEAYVIKEAGHILPLEAPNALAAIVRSAL